MALKTAKEKKILDTLKDLPLKKLEEVLDFAEYLKSRKTKFPKLKKQKLIKLPTYHMGKIEKNGIDRVSIYGEYLDRKLD